VRLREAKGGSPESHGRAGRPRREAVAEDADRGGDGLQYELEVAPEQTRETVAPLTWRRSAR
jgi:hypothetical protein